MDENRQLMAVPHRIFGINEILEAILDQSLPFPITLPEMYDVCGELRGSMTRRAIVNFAAVQRVCKYWHLFIQSSSYLQKRIGMKPVVVHNSFAYWNPIIFRSWRPLQKSIQSAPDPKRIRSLLK